MAQTPSALLPVAFDTLGIGRVILRCDERNAPSIQVALRLGAVQVDTERIEENGECVQLRVMELKRGAR